MKSKILSGVIGLALFSCTCYAQTNNPDQQTTIKTTVKMKEFMLLVRVPATYTTEQAKAVNPQWNMVLDKWKADSVFVTSFVFPGEGEVLAGAERTQKKGFVFAEERKVVSTIILRAASLTDALELAKVCPVLDYGGTIEVREIQPRPVVPVN